ncbi:MAG: hypothetical protein JW768_15885 [Chitinispirillaceae bacterium]|nr:hypothetical protein [Chitinispirillaceae bacterium]
MQGSSIVYGIGCSLVLLYGCAGGLKIKKEYQDDSFSFDMIRDSTTVRVAVANNIDLRGFREPFIKLYGSDQQFARILSGQIADSLQSILGCSVTVAQDPNEAFSLTDQAYSENTLNAIQSLLASTAEEYYLVVETITIQNRQGLSMPMVTSTGPGGTGVLTGGGYSQTCMVTILFKIWDVRQKRKVLSYWSLGEEGVTMLFYGTALKGAIAKALRTAVRYLQKGST